MQLPPLEDDSDPTHPRSGLSLSPETERQLPPRLGELPS